MTLRSRIAALLAKYSYMEGNFTLSSGATSTFYLDAKRVTHMAAGADLVGKAVHDVLREFNADAIGGLTMGADAIIISAVCASAGTDHPVTGFVVRKEAKSHGLSKWIEGVEPSGKRVAIVDDVITSGKSLLVAVDRARAAGAEVVVAIGLVDREQGGAENIRQATGVEVRSICTFSEIKSHVGTR